MPVGPPLPLAVAQEETRPHQQTDQLVLSTSRRPRWRMEDGEMVCVALAPIPLTTPHSTQHLLPLQATTHHGGHPYPGNTTKASSVVCKNLGAMDTRPHTTHHYVPRLIPRDTTTPNTLLAAGANVHFSCECHSSEMECWAKRGIPTKAAKDPPSTQQLVPGRITCRYPFDNELQFTCVD